mmetsp:Transcript_17843/g.49867  ORF Transcript_17843/g.49867 Transcript_17843/m.49867 type:complete len:99 (-) Transcript_17843:262-558(-)
MGSSTSGSSVGSLGQGAVSEEPPPQQQQQRAAQGMQFEGRMDISAAVPEAKDDARASPQSSDVELGRHSRVNSESSTSKAEDRAGSASSGTDSSAQQS